MGWQMSEHYSRANEVATVAAAEKSQALITISKDIAVELQGAQQMYEDEDSPGDPAAKKRAVVMASSLYIFQLSDQAYKAMGLSEEIKKGVKNGDIGGDDIQTQLQTLVDDALDGFSDKELSINKVYQEQMLAKSKELSGEAEKIFGEGIKAKENGDHFDLAEVIFAVSLFFTGISLVFRTRIRWTIIFAGLLFLLGGAVYMITITWTFS